MVWFKVDDRLHSSRKVLSIPRGIRLACVGLWTVAGSWSAHEELDGYVPDYMVTEFGGTQKLVDALLASGLWVTADKGSEFHKWAEYQPTRAELEVARAKETERKRRWREEQSAKNPPPVPPGQDAGREPESGHPDPTRPDPTVKNSSTKSSGTAKRGTRISADFIVTPDMVAWAKEHTPLVDGKLATEKFINYWTAKAGTTATKLDWVLTWRNWMLTDQERQGAAVKAEPEAAPRRVVSGRVG